jgi:membrane protein
MSASDLWAVVKNAAGDFVEDKASRLGAALAFYAVFSIAPLLVISIGIAGLVFGKEAASHQITSQVEDLVGREGADAVATMVESASRPGSGGVGTVLGVLMLVVGASFLFGALQDALNTIWEVQPKPGRGLLGYLRDNLLSMSMVFGVAFLLLVSLVLSAALAAVGSMLGGGKTGAVGLIIQALVDLAALTPLFAAIYRVLPDARIAWADVWLGAAVTAVLFVAGKFLIGFYLGAAGVASAYGAVGSLAVLLLWLYYASQIFLFGAELTKAYANLHGSRVVPKPHAEPVTAEARAQQGIPKQEERAGSRVTV